VRGNQAKRGTKAHTQPRSHALSTYGAEKKIYLAIHQQETHHSSTGFPQLDLFQAAHYP
jgi:hypothetical protein